LKALGARTADRRFLQVVDELRPDMILLHFADAISNAALIEARKLAPGVKIADINIDPIWALKNQRRLAARKGVADALFVTTAEPSLGHYAGPGAFAAFLPNPVDPAIETARVFETAAPTHDVLFPASDDEPREVGGGKMAPSLATALLAAEVPGLRLLAPGVGDEPQARGAAYFKALSSARMGWSLSRRASVPLYASDRMAHFFGSGLCVLLDRRAGFDRFYDGGEAVFYGDLPELAAQVRRLIADDAWARAIARRGWEKTWSLFHADRVFAYLLAQIFEKDGARDYEWPCDRWTG
jgi:hypothetical protein